MKKLIFPIFILLFIFSSCHKEEIIIDKKDVIDPPVEINNALFSGRIIHDNNGVAGADIYIYQKGEKLGKVVSDQDGYYSTKDFELEIGHDVTFEIKSDEYLTKVRRKSVEQEKYKNVDFNVYDKTINKYGSVNLKNPGDTTLVKVYGTFTDINGEPISGAFCMITDSKDSLSNLEGFEITDENGYFEILVEQNVDLYIKANLFIYLSNSFCYYDIIEPSPDSNLGFFKINKLYADYEVIEKPDLQINYFKSNIKGTFLNCNGNTIEYGKVRIALLKDLGYGIQMVDYFDTNLNSNDGELNIPINTCIENLYSIEIGVFNSGDHQYSKKTVLYKEGNIDIGTIQTCTNIKPQPSLMSIKIGQVYANDSIILKNKSDSFGLHLEGLIETSPNHYHVNEFIIEDDVSLGSHIFKVFDFGNSYAWGFKAINGEITTELTEVLDNLIIGTFSGEIETYQLGKQTVTGSFTYSGKY